MSERDQKRERLRERLDESDGRMAVDRLLQIVEEAAEEARASERERLVGELRDRDELWCRALFVLNSDQIERVTAHFNRIRPDRAAPPSPEPERSSFPNACHETQSGNLPPLTYDWTPKPREPEALTEERVRYLIDSSTKPMDVRTEKLTERVKRLEALLEKTREWLGQVEEERRLVGPGPSLYAQASLAKLSERVDALYRKSHDWNLAEARINGLMSEGQECSDDHAHEELERRVEGGLRQIGEAHNAIVTRVEALEAQPKATEMSVRVPVAVEALERRVDQLHRMVQSCYDVDHGIVVRVEALERALARPPLTHPMPPLSYGGPPYGP